MILTLQQRIYLIKRYEIRDILKKFNVKFPAINIAINSSKKLVKKFDETDSVARQKKTKSQLQ